MPDNVMSDEVADDELLYRRIPASQKGWYDPEIRSLPFRKAFHPAQYDNDGISLSRARSEKHPDFLDIIEAARGPSDHGYFVAVLRAGDLKKENIKVVPTPILSEPVNPGHVSLPELTYNDRKSDRVIDLEQVLAEKLTLKVEGPFHVSGIL